MIDACADVAILRNYADPQIARMEFLIAEGLRERFDRSFSVDVFDQGEASLERLLGYKLILWAGLDREGEGLADADVDLLTALHAAGKSLYLLGPRVLGDTVRLSGGHREVFERLCGLRPAGAAVLNAGLQVLPAGYGDPIVESPFGHIPQPLMVSGRTERGELTTTNGFQVKLALEGAPVMVVSPAVCDPDLGQARRATQAFGLAGNSEAETFFKSTAVWLMRGWLCENLEVSLATSLEAPATGRVGETLEYEYRVSQSGSCAAIGVVLSEELPPGWVVRGVETSAGAWEQVGPWLVTTLGCMDRGQETVVRWRLTPTRAGTFTHTVTLAAAREAFNPEKHLVQVTTAVEGVDLAPRLELRVSAPGGNRELWLFGGAAPPTASSRAPT